MLPNFLAFIAIIPNGALASQSMSMDEAVQEAIESNPRIRALRHELAAARFGVSSAGSLANPNIAFTPGFTREGSDEELLIQQPLEINGTRAARKGVAEAERLVIEAESISEFRELVFEVKSGFIAVASAAEHLELSRALAAHAEELDRIASRQVELGTRPGVQRTQTGIEAARSRNAVATASAGHKAALVAFNTLLGHSSAEVAEVTPLTFASAEVAPAQDLIARALASRSEIALIRARRSIFTQQGRLAKAEGIPDLTPHYRMPSVTREPRDGGFGIGISIPLIDYGSRRNRVRQASASAKAEEMRLVDAENAVRRDVTAAYEKLTASKLVVESFRSGILDDAKRLLDATLTGFRLGSSTILEVLEAQRTYRAVQSDYIAALADHAEALALLERAVGGVPAEWLLAEKKN